MNSRDGHPKNGHPKKLEGGTPPDPFEKRGGGGTPPGQKKIRILGGGADIVPASVMKLSICSILNSKVIVSNDVKIREILLKCLLKFVEKSSRMHRDENSPNSTEVNVFKKLN